MVDNLNDIQVQLAERQIYYPTSDKLVRKSVGADSGEDVVEVRR